MTQPELPFDARYPAAPGAQDSATSRAAAEAIAPRAPTLRQQVLDLLLVRPRTADECAQALGKSVLSIRPRVTELYRMGRISDSGITRENASGVRATVWKHNPC